MYLTKIINRGLPVFLLIAAAMIISCSAKQADQRIEINDSVEEALINANKHVLKTEDRQITDYLARYQIPAETSPTGVRYLIYNKGQGERITKDHLVTIKYEVRSLTGELFYSSDKLGNKTFRMGKGEIETGLEEVLLLMKRGDEAKVIIPSYRAWGLTGDGDKIPPKSTLVYEIEIINLKINK